MKNKTIIFLISLSIAFAMSGCIFKHHYKRGGGKGAKKRADMKLQNTNNYTNLTYKNINLGV